MGPYAEGGIVTAFFENFHLLRPWALLLLLLAVALWWASHRASDTMRRWRQVIDPELLKHLTVGDRARRALRPHHLLLVGAIVAIFAVAGPTWQRQPSPFAEQAAPAMIVLKVTPSMMTPDLAPTRLDRARQKIADLLKLRDGMPAGLIAYSGSAHLVLPPTPDRDVVTGMAAALSPAIMPREGDSLADAVKLATQVLRDGGQGGSILVVADNVAPGQAVVLKPLAGGPPVILFAVAPPQFVAADASLAAAVSALDAREVVATVDNQDVTTIARRLADAPGASVAAGEVVRWQEAGWWLTPLIALLVLLWFRRGWVIAT
ncbi:VWA domain-containing protein [Reyranella sp.]|uniref:VWA domain-containing protein n=1 Tax=Reyranella sp. TaxID=1929291 RepID=UPI001215127D|nr:VWA domain-containing protein [Reyranella sp.]TAJ87402.1 MAG: VWA domain-containing protein [Reyranella sp.]